MTLAQGAAPGAAGHAPAILHLVRPAAPLARPMFSLGRHAASCGSDAGVLACAATITRAPWCDHKVIIFGGDDAGRRAAALGLRADARIAPALGRVELGAPALRGWLEAHGEPRVVQCWGGEFAGLRARIAGLSRLSRGAAWCVADLDTGLLESRSGHWPPATSSLTPWLRPPARPRSRPPAGTPSVALLGDAPAGMDALALAYALGILNVGRVPAVAVVPRGAARLDRTLRHTRAGGYLRALEVTDDPMHSRLSSFSLGICIPVPDREGSEVGEPSFGCKIAVRVALDAGLPVIVQDSRWAREVIPADAHTCISPSLEPSHLARTACRLLAEGGLDTARAALLAGQPGVGRDLVKDIVEAWGPGPAKSVSNGAISEPKPQSAPAGSV